MPLYGVTYQSDRFRMVKHDSPYSTTIKAEKKVGSIPQ
ncbi:uncharacterized protein MP3633_0173 [Marinomonas primoryensis]|uniref:Uncharacterized protein n=1 Tax=Marinomonas primoryensis TaxID=178399 RepID=A0A859CWQ0_9GAMM|nr:uncharacterized protein MP3633_0173 [Marinomonas primoryensis]